MLKYSKALIILILPLILTACPTNDQYFGTGPLVITPTLQAGFERYKKAGIDMGYFAISSSGRGYGYSYCSAAQCGGNALMVAIDSCESKSRGEECRIYAEGPTVVWDRSKPKGSNPK